MKNKCIVVGVTAGIAAYKICQLVSSLKKQGNEVHVIMTKEAEKFVTPLTFQTLSSQKVITDMFTVDYTPDVHHISLAKKADLFVVAPATANIIAKIAHGIADDMLTTTFLASTCPKMIVPAMNTNMLNNPITQDNIATCQKYGIHIMCSGAGYLACGDVGAGRLPEPEEIEDAIASLVETDRYLQGRHVVITAGATQEEIDPVRYITNHSTGKMGYALAKEARNAGAKVTLISGKTNLPQPYGVDVINVISAADMRECVVNNFEKADVVIMSAAVADYTPIEKADHKIKKAEGDLSIALKRTQDILLTIGKKKRENQVVIGFAMETENLLENAAKKLQEKNANYIIANSIREPGAGFGVDTNIVKIISPTSVEDLGLLSKDDTAKEILRHCLKK
ncbi:bifunctional phosphopantothenoylcysteine decarboxylase/phosphopantothenate--cysteine ligase CoaBC [Solobacterium moorei]|uniref:bifunctional phosphopantothenoylcysteine decarboxylase/phosphopantothenate--cysteine ligase CoaBC n=1 Tax=Solobacterium moorei TaxID=102148 RepID=UPI0024AE0377|nr:bifunctional phosphopantothenoylcysteine decarboxylase/phosphopantothenate--cysteine ligase CoaBC [Solobacterium moorei]MDI6414950.1 bifunctional phosphopantothenoylcysteine decarboxylase/phosphopantothenate--cysteine ligase CoaBC [Solobacterium moorei]